MNDEFQNGETEKVGKRPTTHDSRLGFHLFDGIHDRNTGIWKDISIYTTGNISLRHPFIKSDLSKPDYNVSRRAISVEVINPNTIDDTGCYNCRIKDENVRFEKQVQ